MVQTRDRSRKPQVPQSTRIPAKNNQRTDRFGQAAYSRPGTPSKEAKKVLSRAKRKLYVLDTNVLIDDPKAMLAFQENDVVIPLVVIEELDGLKKRFPEARMASRILYDLGVTDKFLLLESGGRIRISKGEEEDVHALGLSPSTDNRIIGTALRLHMKNTTGNDEQKYSSVILVSNDVNVAIKARVRGVDTEMYYTNEAQVEDVFLKKVSFPEEVLTASGAYDHSVQVLIHDVLTKWAKETLVPNEGVLLCLNDTNETPVITAVWKGGKLKKVDRTNKTVYENGYVKPYVPTYYADRIKFNPGHEVLIENLFDPKVVLISCYGKAGTGKSKTAVSAALKLLRDGHYEKILITRPNIASGEDIGFLPGPKETKMDSWIAPLRDHIITKLLEHRPKKKLPPNEDPDSPFYGKPVSGKTGKKKDSSTQAGVERKDDLGNNAPKSGRALFDEMVQDGLIEIEASAFVRGRSLENTLVIIDEAQNMSREQGKTWITRIGEGSKLILLGDLDQIDSPHLRKGNNALAVISDKTKGQPWASTLHLEYGVRSKISDWAAQNL